MVVRRRLRRRSMREVSYLYEMNAMCVNTKEILKWP
jgi:hypothetical protein